MKDETKPYLDLVKSIDSLLCELNITALRSNMLNGVREWAINQVAIVEHVRKKDEP